VPWRSGSADRKSTKLADENVHAIIRLADNEALVLEGLSHLSVNEGWARWLKRGPMGAWTTDSRVALDGAPETFAVIGDLVYVVTSKSRLTIGPKRQVRHVHPMHAATLYPTSMVVDAQGSLWLAMRLFVLRLDPDGARFTEHWMAPRDCAHPITRNGACLCKP
jgi:hypothetical protein